LSNSFFHFKQFTIHQDRCAMKVTTDACLFGAWAAREEGNREEGIERTVLDIGGGTGLLSLMIAQQARGARIDIIELDTLASGQAAENVNKSPWANRIGVIHSDAKEYIFKKKYDTIVSNPPFYENELTGPAKEKNLAHHDAGLLLEDVFDLIENNLAPQGHFFLLLPAKREPQIEGLLKAHGLALIQICKVKQTPTHSPFRLMLEGRHSGDKLDGAAINEMIIKNETGKYTAEFILLLKEYYKNNLAI
jgi:tRNA1Val (adenine37-N6)-methyltransferase